MGIFFFFNREINYVNDCLNVTGLCTDCELIWYKDDCHDDLCVMTFMIFMMIVVMTMVMNLVIVVMTI